MPKRPAATEYDKVYERYVARVPEEDVIAALTSQVDVLRRVMGGVTPSREQYRYGEGKWSVRQVVGHLIDGERIFGLRVFCFSRGETSPLPTFEENQYVARSRYDDVPLAELVEEFAAVRSANLSVLRRLDDAAWRQVGTASGYPITVRAIAFVMAGHVRHHLNVLAERYEVKA